MSKKWTEPNWEVEDFWHLKSVVVDGPLPLIIDYDDVQHNEVQLLTDRVAEILNLHWTPVYVLECDNEESEHDGCWDDRWPVGEADEPFACPHCGSPLIEKQIG